MIAKSGFRVMLFSMKTPFKNWDLLLFVHLFIIGKPWQHAWNNASNCSKNNPGSGTDRPWNKVGLVEDDPASFRVLVAFQGLALKCEAWLLAHPVPDLQSFWVQQGLWAPRRPLPQWRGGGGVGNEMRWVGAFKKDKNRNGSPDQVNHRFTFFVELFVSKTSLFDIQFKALFLETATKAIDQTQIFWTGFIPLDHFLGIFQTQKLKWWISHSEGRPFCFWASPASALVEATFNTRRKFMRLISMGVMDWVSLAERLSSCQRWMMDLVESGNFWGISNRKNTVWWFRNLENHHLRIYKIVVSMTKSVFRNY